MSGDRNEYSYDLNLVAVNLVDDALNYFVPKSFCHSNESVPHSCIESNSNEKKRSVHVDGDVLGFVTLHSLSIALNEFRNLMYEQLESLPTQFMFLSKEGWPVSHSQELNLNLFYVINDQMMVMIKRQFERQRFGVQSMNGSLLGFIFAEMDDSGAEIRNLINQELSEALRGDNSFSLIDRNGWPITLKQESDIKVWDLMKNGIFRIIGIKRILDYDVPDFGAAHTEEGSANQSPARKKKRASETSTITVDLNSIRSTSDDANASSTPSVHGSFEHSNHQNVPSGEHYHQMPQEAKPILISYVRAEAEQHARQLKTELTDLGCKVFLDVDEIDGGHDWQDALNNAVLNCDLFVPLITPQYGYTVWTNREVKLADIKQKQIVPISFLETWPPECLAIQFATTQYIPWKKAIDIEAAMEKGEGDRARDIKFWDQPFVRTTALTITEYYRNFVKTPSTATTILPAPSFTNSILPASNPPLSPNTLTPVPQPLEGMSIQMARPTSLFTYQSKSTSYQPQANKTMEPTHISIPKKRSHIVISAHPAQTDFVTSIRGELSKLGFDVWSSTDMTFCNESCMNNNDLLTPSPMTPKTVRIPMGDGSSSDPGSETTLHLGSFSQTSESSQDSQISPQNDLLARLSYHRHRITIPLMRDQLNLYPNCSQYSDFGSQASIFSPEDLDKAQNFRERVDGASIVILVVSKAYCHSRTCKQQAFYCDFRKKVIAIKYEQNFRIPHWLSKLFDDEMLDRDNNDDFLAQLRQKAQSLVSSSTDSFKYAMSEARILALASFISKKLPISEKKKVFVYLAGSTKFFSPLTEPICRAIGQSLASIPFISLVTGGCYGVGETTGRTFCEERELLFKEKPANLYNILPRYASKNLSLKARQNSDGTFQTVPFGHTLFIGDSFKERDSVVARMFNYCILIEGGPRSARIAEEFMWNDNIVIPIICTGGASAGKFDLPAKIHDVPLGVHTDDWNTLMRRDVTAENIADAVKNILCCLVKCRSRKKSREKHFGFKINKSKTNKVRAKT